jgi:hypothetical protein
MITSPPAQTTDGVLLITAKSREEGIENKQLNHFIHIQLMLSFFLRESAD